MEHHPDGETVPGLLVIRFDGTLFFANAPDFVSTLRRVVDSPDPAPQVVMIDGESMNDIDATAVITLKEMRAEMARSGIELRFAQVWTRLREVMYRAGLDQVIDPEHFYPSVQIGVDAFLAEQSNSGDSDG